VSDCRGPNWEFPEAFVSVSSMETGPDTRRMRNSGIGRRTWLVLAGPGWVWRCLTTGYLRRSPLFAVPKFSPGESWIEHAADGALLHRVRVMLRQK
jgi:hypothetical protein